MPPGPDPSSLAQVTINMGTQKPFAPLATLLATKPHEEDSGEGLWVGFVNDHGANGVLEMRPRICLNGYCSESRFTIPGDGYGALAPKLIRPTPMYLEKVQAAFLAGLSWQSCG